MNNIAEYCKNLKKDFTPRNKDTIKPVSAWSEKDLIEGKITDTFVIIFNTTGCSWAKKSGCSMCGYFNDSSWKKITGEEIKSQFDNAMKRYKDQRFVKIFTSGSFLDECEIPTSARDYILKNLVKFTDKISVESRPEYVTENTIKEIKKITKDKIFEIGIGLETADDEIRNKYINKGFTFKQYKKAAETLKKHDIKIKTYVLIKPPFLTEKESIQDAVNTVKKIKNITDTISFNPTNVQKNTYVNFLFKQRKYRPAWLHSVIEILKESKKTAKNVRIKCDVVGGGNIRGAHNCNECDREYLKAISDFSLNQNTTIFEKLTCTCREKWLDQLELENLGCASHINMYK